MAIRAGMEARSVFGGIRGIQKGRTDLQFVPSLLDINFKE